MALFDVIRYAGEPDVFAWKYPDCELRLGTQLIVNESQEAVLVREGRALDVFGSGRHTLSTANLPLLGELVKLPFGGRSPFTAELWFINRAHKLDIRWGTPTPVQIQDAKYGVFVPVRVNGSLGLRVEDSRRFLVKLVATQPVFDQEALVRFFRGLVVSKVKDAVSACLVRRKIGVLEINAWIDELSQQMQQAIQPEMSEYGLRLATFHVNDISVPEEDEAVRRLRSALAKRAEMDIIGYDYRQERSFDVLESAAKNEGAGASLMGAGLGLGMGFGLGKPVGAAFGELAQDMQHSGGATCPGCGAAVPAGAKFCPECGKALSRRCPKCGGKLDGSPKFCPECGEKI